MPQAAKAALPRELGHARLPHQGELARLLALLHAAPDTHLSRTEVFRMAAEIGLTTTPVDVARQLETLADLGLLGRLPSTVAEPIYDTVPEPHSHLVYEETAQIVDLHVSPETLLAILRHALAERPDGLEILVRFRMATKDAGRSQDPAAVQAEAGSGTAA